MNGEIDMELDEFENEEMLIENEQEQNQNQQKNYQHFFPQNIVQEVLNPNEKDPYFHMNMLKPSEWKDSLKVLSDPYQYLVCNVAKKDCKQLNWQMIYSRFLYLMREWSLLSVSQVERVLDSRDRDLQCFEYNKQGKVAVIHKSRIILHENFQKKGNQYDQKNLFILENDNNYQFIAPSYKFSEILIASNRNSLSLIRQILNAEKTCYQLDIIKQYNGYNAEIGRFSRDGKYFIFSNAISQKIYILDLFCHKIFERNTNQKSIQHMSFSRSGLNFLTACRETRTLNVYECVLWEKQQFRFSDQILFADFLDESFNQEMANCILVILKSGEIQVIKDMQFNMLNSANKRINFDIFERQQLITPSIKEMSLDFTIIQQIFIDNILFFTIEMQSHSSKNSKFSFHAFDFNNKNSKLIDYDNLQINKNVRFIIQPTKQQLIYEVTFYNHELEIDNPLQPYFEKLFIDLHINYRQPNNSQGHIY
ncbi:hypothetical protein ABPG74_016062 [Tetrahymena malaccensis]